MPERKLSLFLAGDALITQPWSHVDDPDFLRVVAEMRAADIAIVNLETVIHEFKGHAQADSGGTYMASAPEIAGELKWAGVDMVSAANNHAFDYGSTGVLETIGHVEAAGLIAAGIGEDMQAAREPAVLKRPGATVALVSMASTFVRYGRASRSRPGMKGRPGLNPLGLTARGVTTVTPALARMLGRLRFWRKGKAKRQAGLVRFLGIPLLVEEKARLGGGRGVDPGDLAANLAAIGAAVAAADLTVVSLHAHLQGGWLRRFARRAIGLGADVVFVHGPHEVRGIEIHAGKPIFHCMGSFVYEAEKVASFPAELYDLHGVSDEASAAELMAARDQSPYAPTRECYQGFCAVLQYEDGVLRRIRLLPLDLRFDAPADVRGRPAYADAALGRAIIERVAALSRPLGTTVLYDAERNEGIIEFP
jgi:poly-gamma-glutamate synthesis protein (capsule biosynthesis protein)